MVTNGCAVCQPQRSIGLHRSHNNGPEYAIVARQLRLQSPKYSAPFGGSTFIAQVLKRKTSAVLECRYLHKHDASPVAVVPLEPVTRMLIGLLQFLLAMPSRCAPSDDSLSRGQLSASVCQCARCHEAPWFVQVTSGITVTSHGSQGLFPVAFHRAN